MTENIVHRLRREVPIRGDISLQQLAAAEIERLQKENHTLRQALAAKARAALEPKP